MSGLDELLKGTKGGGLGDLLGGVLGGGGGTSSGGSGFGGNSMLKMLLPVVASMLMNGGLQKMLGRLQEQGQGDKAKSWVDTGANQPISGSEVREAIDPADLDRIAEQLGVSKDEAAEAVAQVLPDVVDRASPDGKLPDDDELDQKFGRLHELGGSAG